MAGHPNQPPPVTGSILYNFIACPHRIHLDAAGDPSKRDEVSPFVAMLWERGTRYEREVIEGLGAQFTDLSAIEADDKERATLEAMARGDSLIYGGRIHADGLVGMPDILRTFGDGYVPGDIKSGAGEEEGGEGASKLKIPYAVQVALYVDVLERIGFSGGRRAFVWDIHGQEVEYDLQRLQGQRKPRSLWSHYEAARETAAQILSGELITKPASSANCKQCHWHSHCLDQLIATDDLTLIPLLGRAIRDVMIDEIPTVRALSTINPEAFARGKNKTIFSGVGPESLRKFQSRALMLSTPGAQPVLTAPISLMRNPRELFFDIEVDPLRDLCYLHGIVERLNGDNKTERFVAFFADEETADAERQAFADAFAYLTADPNAVIYYWSKYERTRYRVLQAKYPDVCTVVEIEALFEPGRAIDLLYDIVTKSTEWPTHDRSIKTLAKFLGFNWRDTHPSGAASIQWFDEWVSLRDPAMKQRILDYNEDDCIATRVVLDGILDLT